ncbi:MAG: DGQHR domain-containing protein [Ginsengibacter sp.]
MRLPYIRIKQRSEIFYVTKFNAHYLLQHLDFNFREPYSQLQSESAILKNEKYIEYIRKKGVALQSSEEGIQRRLQIDRINSIKKFIESDSSNFLPNTVLLSANISDLDKFSYNYQHYEGQDFGEFEFPDSFLFSIIDGQHRLAGLSMVESKLLNQFEIPAVLLLNVSIPTAAKLFADINGKQRAVNKSLIYDLYSNIDKPDFKEIKLFHTICENFYKSEKSPLYRQIKMLGIGGGAISQSFFIDYVRDAVKKSLIGNNEVQIIFNYLFYYFKAFQKTFPEDWPVPIQFNSVDELDSYANYVLKIRKSQLVKTNGFGAILRAFPFITQTANQNAKLYEEIISKLRGNISWTISESVGTGKALQDLLYKQIIELLM